MDKLDSLRNLDEAVLAEVVREGELRMAAQFSAAAASDQRATAWAGFVITITVAAIGASASLALSGKHFPLVVITALLACLLGVAAFNAMLAFAPSEFDFPGNRPLNWRPHVWEAGRSHDMKQARIEQARCLDKQIVDNAEWARKAAGHLRDSMLTTALGVLAAALATAVDVLWLYLR